MDVFAAVVRVMLRVGPADLTLGAIAAEAGLTAGALVQRFGSKRALLHAHARYAAATGDIGVGPPDAARRLHRSRRYAPSRRSTPAWRSRPVRRCEISRTCTTTWRTRSCAVTY